MILPLEQRQLLSKKATELADSIEAGTYKGPTPTNSHGWCGCAAGVLLAAAGMPVLPDNGGPQYRSEIGLYLDDLGRVDDGDLTFLTLRIQYCDETVSVLVEPYRRIASRLLEAP